jgi:hypothetical protein
VAVVIAEIVTELVVAPRDTARGGAATGSAGLSDEEMDAVVRRAAERVVELLRREWDR